MPVGHMLKKFRSPLFPTPLLCRLLLFCLARRSLLRFGGEVYHHTPAVAAALCTGTVRHARGTTLATGERSCLERVVAAALCRLRPRMSHAHYHAYIYSKLGLKRQTRPSGFPGGVGD